MGKKHYIFNNTFYDYLEQNMLNAFNKVLYCSNLMNFLKFEIYMFIIHKRKYIGILKNPASNKTGFLTIYFVLPFLVILNSKTCIPD